MNVNFVLAVTARGDDTFMRREIACLAEKWSVPGSLYRIHENNELTVREILNIYASFLAGQDGSWV
jgi:hypothetical protein